ncbi:MAG: CRTAC1 family protein [Saprospiraceae bacterium]|nr:CRTAC1 family protein [Saprospiraceae bacterium]
MKVSCNALSVLGLLLVLAGVISCKKEASQAVVPGENLPAVNARFTLLSSTQTGVDFSNSIQETFDYNIYTYEYLYNGCGVAVGDVNGDGLPDLYFGSAFAKNKLYLNQGNMTFLDVTEIAGVTASDGYKTGVTMADANGDGLLDIYSCRTSKTDDGKKTDHLFINTGNRTENGIAIPVFEDQAKKLGIDDNSNTNHACFFDMDRDGDLDVFLLNHRTGFEDAVNIRVYQKEDGSTERILTPETPFESNRLYRNDNGYFVDITAKAGMVNSAFGLSATAADINQDGWMDLYVANDYIEPDYIYINNKDGTFTDQYFKSLKHSSQNSMGSDVVDINNDGLVDIMVLDMKTEDPIRYKELAHVMQLDRYNLMVQYGYGRQSGRNVLQLNNGNNTFREIGQFAGISATDWSWAQLIADFDNDGWKDIYITNGYRKDVTNLDYTNFFRDSIDRTGGLTAQRFPDINKFLEKIPSKKISNYLYINGGDLSFINAGKQAGMDHPSFSNGAAYADLDLDGDLDIVVNNIDDPAFIYRNDIKGKNWLQIVAQPGKGNTQGIGTAVDIYAGKAHQYSMVNSNKGFLSSSESVLHFGLGDLTSVDSIILRWPDGSYETQKAVKANQRLVWKRGSGSKYQMKPSEKPKLLFKNVPGAFTWRHRENEFNDFKREKLIPYMLSAEGPCLAVGDINGDKLEDIYAGNATGFAAGLMTQNPNGTFSEKSIPAFINDSLYEDCGSVLEDFDGDGDLDLLVVSGGNSFNQNDLEYLSRYYINDGKGSFQRANNFPIIRTNAGAVLAVDIDGDKDKDIVIGGRSTPGLFPKAPKSYCLRNDEGKFTDVTKNLFSDLEELGMVTDIETGDLDGDGKPEIVLAGEWMPLTVFTFDGGKMINRTKAFGLEKTAGWWKCISITDIDDDGDMDLLAGNIGLNHRMHASETYPVTLIANDFDGNGSTDPIMCYYFNGELYPYAGRDAIIAQIPMLKKKFTRYTPYAKATIKDIFPEDQLEKSTWLYTNTFQTTLFRNEGKSFVVAPLPYQVQLSPVNDMVISDFNADGRKDILVAGNFLYAEPETGEFDAGIGTLLIQQADGSFAYVSNLEHGFWAQDEVRELKYIKLATGLDAILTGNNNSSLELNLITTKERVVQ